MSNSNIVAQPCPKVKESQSSESGNNNKNIASGSTETSGPIESTRVANVTSFTNEKGTSSSSNRTDDFSWWHGSRNESINLKDSTHDLTGHYFDNDGGEWPSRDCMNKTRERKDDATWWHGLKTVGRMQMGYDPATGHYIDGTGREFPNPEACQKFNNTQSFGLLANANKAIDELKKRAKPVKKKALAKKKKTSTKTTAGDKKKTSKKKTAKSKVDAGKIKKKVPGETRKEDGSGTPSSNKRKSVSGKGKTQKPKKSKLMKNKDLIEKQQQEKEQSNKVNTAKRLLLCYNLFRVVQLTNINIMYLFGWGYRISIIKEKRSVLNTQFNIFASASFC